MNSYSDYDKDLDYQIEQHEKEPDECEPHDFKVIGYWDHEYGTTYIQQCSKCGKMEI